MTGQSARLSWPQTDTDAESSQRDDLVQLGMWMFLATVLMLFAAFTSAYIVRRTGADWRPIELPRILWLSTAVLIASSVALERGRLAGKRGSAASGRHGLTAAVALGLVFLTLQVGGWRELVARGVYVPTSPHSSFFYILTGAHGIHVVAGLVLLVYTATRIWSVSAPLGHGASARLVAASATFWHFLAVLWLYLFVLVSVF